MLKYCLGFLLLVNSASVGVLCADSQDSSADVNITHPTRAPFPTATGIFKYVQMCESFCDSELSISIRLAPPEALKSLAGCHKGCYSFELFKVMGKTKSIYVLDKICSASCKKDLGADEYPGKYCVLGCSRMSVLYFARIREIKQKMIEKIHQQFQEEARQRALKGVDGEVEKYMREHDDDQEAEEFAVAVIVEYQKEHASRPVYVHNSGYMEHRRKKIFHVERFVETPEFQQYIEIERRKPFESEEAQKQDSGESSDLDDIPLDTEKKQTVVMKLPSFPKCIENKCLIFEIPIYVLTVFVFVMIVIVLWATFGDPADRFCRSRMFWDKPEHMDVYSTELGEDDFHDVTIPDHAKEMNLLIREEYQDYTCPPPDKDAPPPYVEISVQGNEMKTDK